MLKVLKIFGVMQYVLQPFLVQRMNPAFERACRGCVGGMDGHDARRNWLSCDSENKGSDAGGILNSHIMLL